MRRFLFLPVVSLMALVAAPSAQQGAALKAAADALNVAQIRTLQYAGVGATFYVGQAYKPGEAWPIRPTPSYTVAIDYEKGAIRTDHTEEMGPVFPFGGGGPFMGRGGGSLIARDWNDGWNFLRADTAVPGDAGAIQIWLTPHGFVKASLANNATTRKTREGTEVSFLADGKYKVIGILNEQSLPVHVRTWVDAPIPGDMEVESVYRGYRDYGGVQFPSHMTQTQMGHPAFDLWIMSAWANPTLEWPALRPSQQEASPALTEVQAIAEGVYIISAPGTNNSLVVEMRDYLVVGEANGEDQSLAFIAKLKEMFPTKPVRYIVNTHHHWDHSKGLRMWVAAGATVVTHQQNKEWFEKALAAPRTLDRNNRPQSKTPPRFLAVVGDKGEITDGQRVIELHVITGIRHAGGMLMVYLPKERIVFEADAWSPLAGGAPTPPARVLMARALNDTIRRLNLQVDHVVSNHNRESSTKRGQTFPMANLTKDAAMPLPQPTPAPAFAGGGRAGGRGFGADGRGGRGPGAPDGRGGRGDGGGRGADGRGGRGAGEPADIREGDQ